MVAILVGAYHDPGAALGAVITGLQGVVGAGGRVPLPPWWGSVWARAADFGGGGHLQEGGVT